MMLWFFVFLMIRHRAKQGIIGAGIFFMAGVFVVRFLYASGFFDHFLLSKPFDIFLDISYFLFIVLSFGGGIYFWKRWCVLRRGEARDKAVPLVFSAVAEPQLVLQDKQKSSRVNKFGLSFITFLKQGGIGFGSGFLLGLLQTAWAPDSYIQYTTMKMTLPADYLIYALLLSAYSLAFVGLLSGIFLSVVLIRRAEFFRRWLEKSAPLLSIISSAILLAYGVGFLTYYLP